MNFEESLNAELETVAGLIGKVFPINATEGTKAPYLVYMSSDGLKDKTLGGYLSTKEVHVELNVFGSSYSNLRSFLPLVISKIESFQSRIIGTNGPYIQNVTLHEPHELWEGALKLWRSNIEISFKF